MSLLLSRESALLSRIATVLPGHRLIPVAYSTSVPADAATGPRVYLSLRQWDAEASALVWSVLLVEDDARGPATRRAGISGEESLCGILPSLAALRPALDEEPYQSLGGQYRRAIDGILAWEEQLREVLDPAEDNPPETPSVSPSRHEPLLVLQVQHLATIAAETITGEVLIPEIAAAFIGDRLLLVKESDRVHDFGAVIAGEGVEPLQLAHPIPIGTSVGDGLFRVSIAATLASASLLRLERDFERDRPLQRTLTGSLRAHLRAAPLEQCRIEFPPLDGDAQQQLRQVLQDILTEPERLLLTGDGEALVLAVTHWRRDRVPAEELARWIIEGESQAAVNLAFLQGGTP